MTIPEPRPPMDDVIAEVHNAVSEIRNFESFQSALRNFSSWLNGVVPGASDIDGVLERHGQLLFFEAKPWMGGVMLPWGQHLLLQAIAAGQPNTVLLIGESANSDTVHWLTVGTQSGRFVRKGPGVPVSSMWFPPECFRTEDKTELAQRVKKWYDNASTLPKPRYLVKETETL